jgi:hypothetical protein
VVVKILLKNNPSFLKKIKISVAAAISGWILDPLNKIWSLLTKKIVSGEIMN